MNILCIETGTDVCSVGLARGGEMVALMESTERDHGARVAVFVEEVLRDSSLSTHELDAVAVSKGPGSYTGLRIGVSFAKGLCCGLNIPLIGVGSLESLCEMAANSTSSDSILIPMIDARRMEVYCQVFDAQRRVLKTTEAVVVDGDSFAEWRNREVYIFGDGAQKCREVLPWAKFLDARASARGMVRLAAEAFAAKRFEDVAYFEPFYLKDFVITTAKKQI